MLFKCKPICVNAFYCNTHCSLDTLGLGPIFTDVPPVKWSHVGPCKSLGNQVLQVSSLSVATSMFKPPTPISFKTEVTDFISFSQSLVMTTIPNIPVWIIKITRILQYLPAKNVKSAAIEVSAGLWSSPPSWWRLLAEVLPRPCTQESQPLSYGQWPRASCCRKRLTQQLELFKFFWKIWFRFFRNNFFLFP